MQATLWCVGYIAVGFVVATICFLIDKRMNGPNRGLPDLFVLVMYFWPLACIVILFAAITKLLEGYIKWLQK